MSPDFRFGAVVKFKDSERGPEMGRFMAVVGVPIKWGSKMGVRVICLTVHPGDGWQPGEDAPCDMSEMEVVRES